MDITVYGRDNCPACAKAKDLLKIKSLEYEYIDVLLLNKDERDTIKDKYQMETVPIIIIKDQDFVGGYTDLEEWFNTNNIIGIPTRTMGIKAT